MDLIATARSYKLLTPCISWHHVALLYDRRRFACTTPRGAVYLYDRWRFTCMTDAIYMYDRILRLCMTERHLVVWHRACACICWHHLALLYDRARFIWWHRVPRFTCMTDVVYMYDRAVLVCMTERCWLVWQNTNNVYDRTTLTCLAHANTPYIYIKHTSRPFISMAYQKAMHIHDRTTHTMSDKTQVLKKKKKT